MWALNPSWRRCWVSCARRVSGSTTEITRSGAVFRAIRHRAVGAFGAFGGFTGMPGGDQRQQCDPLDGPLTHLNRVDVEMVQQPQCVVDPCRDQLVTGGRVVRGLPGCV